MGTQQQAKLLQLFKETSVTARSSGSEDSVRSANQSERSPAHSSVTAQSEGTFESQPPVPRQQYTTAPPRFLVRKAVPLLHVATVLLPSITLTHFAKSSLQRTVHQERQRCRNVHHLSPVGEPGVKAASAPNSTRASMESDLTPNPPTPDRLHLTRSQVMLSPTTCFALLPDSLLALA